MHPTIASAAVLVLVISMAVFTEGLAEAPKVNEQVSNMKRLFPPMFAATNLAVTQACNRFPDENQKQADFIQQSLDAKYSAYYISALVFKKTNWNFSVFSDGTYKGTCGGNTYLVVGQLKLNPKRKMDAQI